jgi:uncharacterized repeat protein (TIGR01451 family)
VFADPPRAITHFVRFDDINGNGQLDCGEPVTIEAAYNASGQGSPASGTLTAPTSAGINLGYLPGSAVVTPDHQAGCNGSVREGFDPFHDPTWTADFSCDPTISLPPGTYLFSVTYKATYTARAGVPGFTSAVEADVNGQVLTDTEPQAFATATCSGPATPLKITKTASGNAVPGSPLTFTLTASNTASLGVGGIQLIDTVPPNTTFSPSLSSTGWVCSPNSTAGSMCRLPLGNLVGNASASAIFAVTVASPLAAGVSSISNTACVSEGPTQVDDCASVAVATAGTPMLALTKSLVSGNGTPGATVVYSVAVQNTGNQGAGNVTLSETVPANTTFSPAGSDPGWQCLPSGAAGSTCTFPVGALPAGSSHSARFAVVVASTLPTGVQSISNTACAKSTDAPDDCHTVTIPTNGLPALNVTKTLTSGDGTPGSTLLFSVAVQNTGNEGAALVNLQETVPAQTVFDPAKSDPAWVCSSQAAGSACSLSLPMLAAGASQTAAFAVTIDNPLPAGVTTITNSACASASGVSITCSTAHVTPNAAPRIVLTKSYGGGPIRAGDHVAFTLTAINTGNEDSEPLALTEIVPANTTFDLATSSPGWSCAPDTSPGSTCKLSLPGLAAGATLTRTASFLVTTLPPGVSQVANTACIAEATTVENGKTRVSSTCSQAMTPPEAKVTMTLTALPLDPNHNGAADPGESLRYTLQVTSVGQTAATGLSVTAHLDPRLHFVPGSVISTLGTVTSGNSPSDTTFVVELSSLAAGGGAFGISFEAKIDPGTTEKSVQTQAFASGTNFPLAASDDPATPAPDDPTVTPISVPFVTEIPTLNTWGLLSLFLSLGCAGTGALWKYRQ